MSDYQTLFELQVDHDYFVRGDCPCLEFVPSDETQRILRHTGLLLKNSDRGLWVAYDREQRDALQLQLRESGEGLDLWFKVYATDAQFRSYTEPFGESMQRVLYFTNRSMPAGATRKARLHTGKVVSDEDFVDMDAAEIAGVLDSRDRLAPPVCLVRIQAGHKRNPLFDKKDQAKTPCFTIHFTSRRTYWKYLLQGDRADAGVFVFDPEGRIEFDATGPDRLADGTPVLTYRSKRSIPLSESFDFKFQLKQKKNGVDKVLYRQLPFARVGQAGKEVVAQQAVAVSEIYINY